MPLPRRRQILALPTDVTQDVVAGIPRMVAGSGPPLVYLPGLSPQNGAPPAWNRVLELSFLRTFTPTRMVHWMGRRRGVRQGTTMAELAEHQAQAMAAVFPGPVDVLGASTGGSLAQQLAADHPHLVRRLVLVSTGCRLDPVSVRLAERVASSVRHGEPGQALGRLFAELTVPGPLRLLSGAAGRAVGVRMYPEAGDLSDLSAVMLAEAGFDLSRRGRVLTAPTLLVVGGRDRFYGSENIEATLRCGPDVRLVRYDRRGHLTVLLDPRFRRDVLGFLG